MWQAAAVRSLDDLPEPVRAVIKRWLAVHDDVATGLIEGLYLVGSVALDDWHPRSDIDIIAVTADPATDDDAARLRAAYAAAAADVDTSVDGPRLAWGDLAVPPSPLHRPWTLDGEFHHDGDCFEINPVVWFTLVEYGVAVRGDDPPELIVAVDADARRSFVRENVDTYWRSVGEQLTAALADSTRIGFPAEVGEWSVLGVARMLVTFRTGDVASKSAAGAWAREQLPDHADAIDLALRTRATVGPAPVGRDNVARVRDLVDHVVGLITS